MVFSQVSRFVIMSFLLTALQLAGGRYIDIHMMLWSPTVLRCEATACPVRFSGGWYLGGVFLRVPFVVY